MDWRQRIEIVPDLHHGEPCIRGTRVPVSVILSNLAEGFDVQEVLREYPALDEDDVRAALLYAAEIVRDNLLLPLG